MKVLEYRSPKLTSLGEMFLQLIDIKEEYYKKLGDDLSYHFSPDRDEIIVVPEHLLFWVMDYCLKVGKPFTSLPAKDQQLLYWTAMFFSQKLLKEGLVDETADPTNYLATLGLLGTEEGE